MTPDDESFYRKCLDFFGAPFASTEIAVSLSLGLEDVARAQLQRREAELERVRVAAGRVT